MWNGVIGPVFRIHCGIRQGCILSPLLLSVYNAKLLNDLCNSGYDVYIGSLFAGVIADADDNCILSCSCYGLQKLLQYFFCIWPKMGHMFQPSEWYGMVY